MRTVVRIAAVAGIVAATAFCASAQGTSGPSPTGAPGVILDGSNTVSVGGADAARSGDRTTDGSTVTGTSTNVFINGRPAVTLGDGTDCGGITVGGSSNVFVNGKPLARSGDLTSGCGK